MTKNFDSEEDSQDEDPQDEDKEIDEMRDMEEMDRSDSESEKKADNSEKLDQNENKYLEDVSESGRIFVRNLPYICNEDDIVKWVTKSFTV